MRHSHGNTQTDICVFLTLGMGASSCWIEDSGATDNCRFARAVFCFLAVSLSPPLVFLSVLLAIGRQQAS